LKKLLLYRRGGLGDTLLTFPLLEIFKGQGFHITTVGNTDYFEIAKEVGWADRVLSEVPKEGLGLYKKSLIGTSPNG
jgi:ADP-heptose:LPS heptosyltransferase